MLRFRPTNPDTPTGDLRDSLAVAQVIDDAMKPGNFFVAPDLQIHVTRGLQAYVWEGYDAGGGVIESREVVKWTREVVGTITLTEFTSLEDVQDELVCQIWQAVVGASRLPLTSVEAPLPAFVFG